MTLQSTLSRPPRVAVDPPVVLDAAYVQRLQDMASAAWERLPDVAVRLSDEIGRATVMPSRDMPADVVNIGSTVRFRDETTGREQTVTLVLPQDEDIAQGRVSVLTPVGAALLGLAEGASMHWFTRHGEKRPLKVLRVTRPA